MIASTFTIPDGTTMTDATNRGGRMFGTDPVTKRTCTYQGDATGGRLVDSAGELIREIVPQAATAPAAAPASAATSASKSTGGRGRWLTFNTFVDRVARHLELHEQAVWVVIFRAVQDDTAEIGVEDIATKINRSARTVKRAVDRLVAVGLLERLRRGTKQSGPTRYRLEADPAVALPRLTPATAAQRDASDTLKQTPKRQKRDRHGAFST